MLQGQALQLTCNLACKLNVKMKKRFILSRGRKTNSAGFSLIEFLVALSIVSILTAVVVFSYRPLEKGIALQQAAAKLAQDIRRAEGMAISSQDYSPCGDGYQHGYGVLFNKQSEPGKYSLFADCNNNGDYELEDQIIETIDFEQGISITSLSSGNSDFKFLKIVFTPPDPTTTIKSFSSFGSGTITLSNSRGQSKKIEVNKVGLIYVK